MLESIRWLKVPARHAGLPSHGLADTAGSQTTPEEIFARTAEELARLVSADGASVCRYEADQAITVAAEWTHGRPNRWPAARMP
jgi:hypothetical protein